MYRDFVFATGQIPSYKVVILNQITKILFGTVL